MQQIVLTTAQRDFLIEFKKPFQELLNDREVDFVPVQINTLDVDGKPCYILPVEVLDNVSFAEIKQALIDGDHLSQMVIRDITESELITVKREG